MSNIDYIINSLKIANIIVDNFQETSDSLIYHISTKKSFHTCPCCGASTSIVHDYRKQKIKDISIHHKKVIIVLNKRRYACKHCGKKFYENFDFLCKYKRTTKRLNMNIFWDLCQTKSMKQIAKENFVSQYFVQNVLDHTVAPTYSPTNIISIDEFRGNANSEKFQCILTDPIRKVILDILPNRNTAYLDNYFSKIQGKSNVLYVVMDMWKPYAQLAKRHFKNATIVIDRYHFVRQVTWALENVRKRIQKHLTKENRLFFKHSKKLLLTPKEKLTLEQKDLLYVMFNYSDELRIAYEFKTWFYEILNNARDKEITKSELKEWISCVRENNIKEFKECVRSFTNWLDPICNGMVISYSNGFTEGKNNKIKVLKRISYGYKTLKNLRKRILLTNKKIFS